MLIQNGLAVDEEVAKFCSYCHKCFVAATSYRQMIVVGRGVLTPLYFMKNPPPPLFFQILYTMSFLFKNYSRAKVISID